MTQIDDLSRSLGAFDQATSLIAVVELSATSWLVAGLVPGRSQMARTHRRAASMSAMSGKRRWNSTMPDSAPPSWQARRIALAVGSSTANMNAAAPRAHLGKHPSRDQAPHSGCEYDSGTANKGEAWQVVLHRPPVESGRASCWSLVAGTLVIPWSLVAHANNRL